MRENTEEGVVLHSDLPILCEPHSNDSNWSVNSNGRMGGDSSVVEADVQYQFPLWLLSCTGGSSSREKVETPTVALTTVELNNKHIHNLC